MALFSSTIFTNIPLCQPCTCPLACPLSLLINQGRWSFDTVQNTLLNTHKVSIEDYSWLRKMSQGRLEPGLVHDEVKECL